MLLFFHLGDVRYALECQRVKEICPLVEMEKVPHAPDHYAGLIHYRGTVIPVVDLRKLFHREPCRVRFSTRVIVMDFSNSEDIACENRPDLVGLMAEKVVEAQYRPEDAFADSGIRGPDFACISSVMMESNRATYLIDPDSLRERL